MRSHDSIVFGLNQAGASGFHGVPNGALTTRGEWNVVLERATEAVTFRYTGFMAVVLEREAGAAPREHRVVVILDRTVPSVQKPPIT